jgi:hypothetical protein
VSALFPDMVQAMQIQVLEIKKSECGTLMGGADGSGVPLPRDVWPLPARGRCARYQRLPLCELQPAVG